MKISTLLSENYESQLQNDINVYLVRLKANGIPSIGTDIMARELNDLGHSVTPESLVDMLANSKYITKVTTDSIELVGAPTSDNKDDARDTVKKLAVKASKKRI
jgi:hypothetical protein